MSLCRKQSSPAILILFLIILASACNNSEISSDVLTINIDEIEDNSPINYSQIFDDYNVIPLKFSGDSTLMRINDITVLEDRIIAFDRKGYKGILIYNLEGRIISGIKNRGRGPGEYVNISGIDVDSDSEQIFLYDWHNKICIYDFNGLHIGDKKLKNGYNDIAYLNSKYYLCSTSDTGPVLTVFDHSWKTINTINDQTGINRSHVIISRTNGDFYKNQNKLYLSFPLDNTIFIVENNKLVPYINIESKEFEESNSETLNENNDYLSSIRINDILYSFSKNDEVIFFQIRKRGIGKLKCFHIIDKSLTYTSFLEDDLTFVSPEFLQLSGSQMITFLSPETIFWLKEKYSKKGTPKIPPKLAKELNKISYDNYYPLLIIYDLKEEFEF